MIPPGETIGILGGGQLGRMIAMAAAQLGYRCHVFAPESDAIAAEVTSAFTCADWSDREAMARFANDCAVITYEFENVPVGPVAALAPVPVLPHWRALECAQDRLAEKIFVAGLGGTTAPYAQVDSDADLLWDGEEVAGVVGKAIENEVGERGAVNNESGAVVAQRRQLGKRALEGGGIARRLDVFHAPVRMELLRVQRVGNEAGRSGVVKAVAPAILRLI